MKTEILNSKGQPVVLSPREAQIAAVNQHKVNELCNAMGFEIDITTLTQVLSRVVDQKFFQIAPADYIPIKVGEGAWAAELLTYRSFQIGGDFEQGLINTATENARLAEVSSGVDAVRVPINNWAKIINWSLFDLNLASRSGNWDVVTSKEKSRKTNWDLGIQKIAFLGASSNPDVKGLLTQTDVNVNTTLITEAISGMDVTEFTALVSGIIGDYRANAQYTAYPDRFYIPESDYNGLAAPVNPAFPINSKLQYLLEAFRTITGNPAFKILPIAYANQAQNAGIVGLNKNRYTLMRYDEDVLRMDIPVDYTSTLQNTLNGFQYQSVAYGQFTGVQAYRPAEIRYYDWAA